MKLLDVRVLILIFLVSNNLKSNNDSDKIHLSISLLTFSPGQNVYNTFGHSAIRIRDFQKGTDYVYNYGSFDFETPGFYFKFIKGKLLYRLSKMPYNYVLHAAEKEKRTIISNNLILTNSEKKKIAGYLKNNYLPDNREYLYDFLYDNCATKFIYIIDSVTNKRLKAERYTYTPLTYSELLKPYLRHKPWVQLGIDMISGRHLYSKASLTETGFLPDHLKNVFNYYSDNNKYLLDKDEILINSATPKNPHNLSPTKFMLVILLIAILLRLFELSRKTFLPFIDEIILGIPILLGIIIILLWLFSHHYIYSWNYNLLWANPLWILLLVNQTKKNKTLIYAAISLLILAIIINLIVIQSAAIILFVLILLTRLLFRYQLQKNL